MARPPARRAIPAPRPKRSLGQAILRCLGRLLRVCAERAIWLWIWAVDVAIACFLWPCRNPLRSWKLAWGGLWRIATAISVSYLVFDRIYEISAIVSSPASDPKQPFFFPFTITNQSHLFNLKDISWNCYVVYVKAGGIEMSSDQNITSGTTSVIEPGQSKNIPCDIFSSKSHFFNITPEPKVDKAVIEIKLSYTADIYIFRHWYDWQRHPAPTRFTWMTDATNPQWIKGEFIK